MSKKNKSFTPLIPYLSPQNITKSLFLGPTCPNPREGGDPEKNTPKTPQIPDPVKIRNYDIIPAILEKGHFF